MQVSLNSAALREARAELAEARKQWHSLQVEIETLHALVRKPLIITSPQPTPRWQTNTYLPLIMPRYTTSGSARGQNFSHYLTYCGVSFLHAWFRSQLSDSRCSGERPGDFAAEHPAGVLQPTAGPLPGDHWAGGGVGACEDGTGHPAPTPQPAPEYQDEARAGDRHLQASAGARRGQVRQRERMLVVRPMTQFIA